MADTLRWGILGTGQVAHDFASDLVSTSHSQLVHVASGRVENATAFAQIFKDCKAQSSPEALIAAPDVDVIYIATPNDTHAALAIQCLEAGKHILIEKPFATCAHEARAIRDTAKTQDRFCMEAMWSRFLPIAVEVRRLVDEGAIGKLVMARAELGEPRFQVGQGNETGGQAGANSAAALDLGVYCVSVLQYLTGAADDAAMPRCVSGRGTDAQMAATFEMNGVIAQVSASHVSRLGNALAIYGTHGSIEIEAPFFRSMRARLTHFEPGSAVSKRSSVSSDSGVKQLLKKSGAWPVARSIARKALGKDGQTLTKSFDGYGYRFQADEVARCIGEGLRESPIMPLRDSVGVLELLDQIGNDQQG
ncbi:MAG: Gfo/Idh/MocA family oxidoreductase [Alphaproteobacteria bacterium]|nr:Gfo/Idh/MocA family oxidoreductase [Alphaproteobacteria bacterium]